MNKFFTAGLIILSLAASVSATPLLIETYQEAEKSIPAGETDTLVIVDLSFSVDSACYVQLGVGGMALKALVWLDADGEVLPPVARAADGLIELPVTFIYTYKVEPGEHTFSLKLANYLNSGYPTRCKDSYLQALIFLPEGGGAVAEQQPVVEPVPEMESVISKAPYVNVAGAAALFDASGREIEHAIQNDRVTLSSLAPGTYFAKDNEDRTVVKIVKVD